MTDNKKTILSNKIIEKIKKAFDKVLFYDYWQEAYTLVRKLEPMLLETPERIPQDFRDELKELIIKGKWISLPTLKDNEVIELFKNYFTKQFELIDGEFDVWTKLRAKLVSMPLYEDRDVLRKKVKNVLLNNEELITSKGPLNDEDEILPATIKNWLIDYIKTLGNEEKNPVMINNYIIKHNIISKLSEKEQSNLKKLFNFYEIVKISSLDPKGYEEEISVVHDEWGPGIMVAGKFVPKKSSDDMKEYIALADEVIEKNKNNDSRNKEINDKKTNKIITEKYTKNEDILQNKFDQFLNNWLMVEIMKEIKEIEQAESYKMEKMRTQFYHAVNHHNINKALANLFSIAEHGDIRDAFANDKRYQNFWGNYVEKNNLGITDFRKNPAQVKYLAMFFKYIMIERLKLDEEQAVMLGTVLANLCRQSAETEYQQIAYGDMEDGEFKWNI